ncbi:MAG: cysteine-rich CWC family protein [Bacteroidales bacterium]|nr:cysteine-rich CWC family protein [Bacteroidales bacterium]
MRTVICPRCGASFNCHHDTISHNDCWCTCLTLPPTVLAQLQHKWPDQCLCKKCLEELANPLTKV